MPALRVLTPAQLHQYHEDGYLVVPEVFSKAIMAQALEASDQVAYGMPFDEWASRVSGGEPLPLHGAGVAAVFATGRPALDRLVENEIYLDITCDLLGTDDLHYVNGHLFVRAGPVDTRHAEQAWQGYHIDQGGVTFLPPSPQPEAYDYLGSGIFLHDVDEQGAPVMMVPGSHRRLHQLLPDLHRRGLFQPPGTFSDVREVPAFARRVPLTARTGSVCFSSGNLVHAAVPFQDRTRQRALWTMSFARQADGLSHRLGNAYGPEVRHLTTPFWCTTSARVRSLFGWPRPGHPYYTPETLALMRMWYPAMDLTPYVTALALGARPGQGARPNDGPRTLQPLEGVRVEQ